MSKTKTFVSVVLCLLVLQSNAWAHYLWIAMEQKKGEQPVANLYFEEGPRPGDGHYLDPFIERGSTWIRTVESPKPEKLEMKEAKEKKNRWLSGTLSGSAPRSIDSYGKWGVYRYGKTDVLLHYYAKYLDLSAHEDLHELGHAKEQKLDIAPHDHGDAMNLTVIWDGKPASGRPVFVRGPKGFRETLKTDDKGRASFKPEAEGQYNMRTNVVLAGESGEFEGKAYQEVRHHATLTMNLPLKE